MDINSEIFDELNFSDDLDGEDLSPPMGVLGYMQSRSLDYDNNDEFKVTIEDMAMSAICFSGSSFYLDEDEYILEQLNK